MMSSFGDFTPVYGSDHVYADAALPAGKGRAAIRRPAVVFSDGYDEYDDDGIDEDDDFDDLDDDDDFDDDDDDDFDDDFDDDLDDDLDEDDFDEDEIEFEDLD